MDTRSNIARRSAQHTLLFASAKRRRWVWALGGASAFIVAAVLTVLAYSKFDWSAITRAIDQWNPVAVLPLMAVLPVFGFPIVAVYLVAGARFGPVLGGVVVTAVTAVHLLASFALANSFLRRAVERFVARRHVHLPEIPPDEHAAVALIAVLVPGIPYVVRNYLLPLAGVRLRVYFWVCLPIYVARSYVTILLGDLSGDPNRTRLLVLLGVEAIKVVVCGFVIWRLRQHHRRYHPAHDAAPAAG
jgi:uncharacterized membrane protein YdjX (TVP38/TMEM64 family)